MKNCKLRQLPAITCMVILATFILPALSCKSKSDSDTPMTAVKMTDTLSYNYKATYSSDITVPSHPEYAQKVLTVWKMFENAQFDSMKHYYADTVTYEDASGFRFHGKSEDLMNFAKKDIQALDSMRFDISMWQSVHINDRNEDWVYIWAAERRYPKNGKPDTSLIHEQWKITNGKVSFFNQYMAKHR